MKTEEAMEPKVEELDVKIEEVEEEYSCYQGRLFAMYLCILWGPEPKRWLITLCLIQIPTILHEIFHLEWFSHQHHFGVLYVLFTAQFFNLYTLMILCVEDPGFLPKIVHNPSVRNTSTKQKNSACRYPEIKAWPPTSKPFMSSPRNNKISESSYAPPAMSTDLPERAIAVNAGDASREWIIIVHGLALVLAKKIINISTHFYSPSSFSSSPSSLCALCWWSAQQKIRLNSLSDWVCTRWVWSWCSSQGLRGCSSWL